MRLKISLTIFILCLIFPDLQAGDKEDCTLKAGSWNLCTSDSRLKKIKQGKFTSEQRYWCNSSDAVAAMFVDMDCDVMGLNEICDSIWSDDPKVGLRQKVAAVCGEDRYGWVLFPNTYRGMISYDSAIAYKKSRLKLMDSDIFWMTETPDTPKGAPGAPKGSNRPAVWAKFKDLKSGKQFYFISTHLVLGSMHNDGGNEYNATNFIDYASDSFSPKIPSIVAGDFNSGHSRKSDKLGEGFRIMCSSRWKDTFLTLREGGTGMSEETLSSGTQPSPDESVIGSGVIDHILFDGFTPLSLLIDRRRFPTADGSLHYPSDHLPLVAVFTMP